MTLRRTLRQTLTVARRDFIATVFTPVFLLFLLAPAVMGGFGAIGGFGAASMSGRSDRARIVAILPADRAAAFAATDRRLRAAFRDRTEAPPPLRVLAPRADVALQARTLIDRDGANVAAIVFGPADTPHILYSPRGGRAANYLQLVAETTRAAAATGGVVPRLAVVRRQFARTGPSERDGNRTAFLAVFGIFFLTLFLAGQVVSTMAEERNNKVIEVLAAAVPLETVFLGKLVGMFGVALLFIAFWGAVLGALVGFLPSDAATAFGALSPAIGSPGFALLFAAYFTMAYLLLGSVFLAVGAQASTMREIQMLSLPITIVQVGMFGLASAATSDPDGLIAWVAAIFPLSSPFAMAGYAAMSPRIPPHVAALVWQLLWVSAFIVVGARLFRRGVLQSGSPRRSRARTGSA